MGISKEGYYHEITNKDFSDQQRLEQLGLGKLKVGSDNYLAVKKALEIDKICYLDLLIVSVGKQRSGLDLMLLNKHKGKIDEKIEEIVKANGDNQMFADKFREICEFIMFDLENTPSIMLSYRFLLLQGKIQEAEQRTDLV